MKIREIAEWLDRTLDAGAFDDVSNNGVQVARRGEGAARVAFAVDASVAAVRGAAAAGAQLLVVHHGISWGGGIRRIVGGEYEVVKAAMDANVAIYASHLPLDANRRFGNNWEIARFLGLKGVRPAFSYHGNVIGVVGAGPAPGKLAALGEVPSGVRKPLSKALVGVCSGGAGEFAAEAKRLGCGLFVTGEASWGDVVAAENVGMPMMLAGHYETETFGVRALCRAVRKALRVETVFLGRGGEASE